MKESKPRQRKKKQETKTTSKTEGEWFILAMLCLYWCHTAPIHTTKSKRRRVQAMSSDDDSEPGDTVTSKHFISSTLLILYVYLNSDILISCICFAQKECRTEWIKCSGKIILAGLALLLMTSVNRNPVMKEHRVVKKNMQCRQVIECKLQFKPYYQNLHPRGLYGPSLYCSIVQLHNTKT